MHPNHSWSSKVHLRKNNDNIPLTADRGQMFDCFMFRSEYVCCDTVEVWQMLSNHTWKRILQCENCLSPPSPSCRERLIKVKYKKLGPAEHNRKSIAVGCIRIGGWLLVILESGWGAFTQKAHLARAYDGWRGKGNNRNGDKKAMYFPFSLKTREMWKRFGRKLYWKIFTQLFSLNLDKNWLF